MRKGWHAQTESQVHVITTVSSCTKAFINLLEFENYTRVVCNCTQSPRELFLRFGVSNLHTRSGDIVGLASQFTNGCFFLCMLHFSYGCAVCCWGLLPLPRLFRQVLPAPDLVLPCFLLPPRPLTDDFPRQTCTARTAEISHAFSLLHDPSWHRGSGHCCQHAQPSQGESIGTRQTWGT